MSAEDSDNEDVLVVTIAADGTERIVDACGAIRPATGEATVLGYEKGEIATTLHEGLLAFREFTVTGLRILSPDEPAPAGPHLRWNSDGHWEDVP